MLAAGGRTETSQIPVLEFEFQLDPFVPHSTLISDLQNIRLRIFYKVNFCLIGGGGRMSNYICQCKLQKLNNYELCNIISTTNCLRSYDYVKLQLV